MLSVINVLCNGKEKNLLVEDKNPYFSFIAETDEKKVIIKGCWVIVASDREFNNIIWDSELQFINGKDGLKYDGQALKPHSRYYYKMCVLDSRENLSKFSEIGYFDTGFLEDEWLGRFIGTADNREKEGEVPCYLLSKGFHLKKKVEFAKLYCSAKGMYEAKLNGKKVGDYYLTPGFTSYNNRLQYQSYDVTDNLYFGENNLEILLGDGWYKGYINWNCKRNFYGDKRKAILQLVIKYSDGTTEVIASDESFKWTYSPIVTSEIYHGEVYDARREKIMPKEFKEVTVFDDDRKVLVGEICDSVKCVKVIKPQKLIKTPSGETVIDLGQDIIGNVRIKVAGKAGEKVRLKHGEILDKNGCFYSENIEPSKQEVEYILKGDGVEVYEPHFTYQCFRYIKVLEFPGEPSVENFEGIVLSSFQEVTGEFSCSDEMVNRLQSNIQWSQRGNFIDIPIAGPQRTERLGWTGDAQIFVKTACFNMNSKLFFHKWLEDLKYDQFENGAVPWVVPNVLEREEYDCLDFFTPYDEYPTSAAWGDAALIVPWTLYVRYNDKDILEKQYDSMKKYVEFMKNSGEDEYSFTTGFHYGDWFALDAKEGSFVGATPKEYIATAFYAYSTWILVKVAKVIGEDEDFRYYSELHKRIVDKFRSNYIDQEGELKINTQTAAVLALRFELISEEEKRKAFSKLVKLLEERNFHISTGFVGTSYIQEVLTEGGRPDLAYTLLLNKDCPSWLYQITKGATTIWEHWDGIKPDGSMWDPWMNSFNHYAYGCVGDWMYSTIAGIKPDENNPGYKHFFIKPRPDERINSATGKLKTIHGEIAVSWKLQQGEMDIKVKVPCNTTASIILPEFNNEKASKLKDYLEKNYCELGEINGSISIKAGSGEYSFKYSY